MFPKETVEGNSAHTANSSCDESERDLESLTVKSKCVHVVLIHSPWSSFAAVMIALCCPGLSCLGSGTEMRFNVCSCTILEHRRKEVSKLNERSALRVMRF